MKRNKERALLAFFVAACMIIVSSCGADIFEKMEDQSTGIETETVLLAQYTTIPQEQAKQWMDSRTDCVILDVRTDEEYNESHIPGAILIPDYEIALRAEGELPDKEQLILVYCRSGRRSKLAAQTLADLGYRSVYEFGGIIDWQYEVE